MFLFSIQERVEITNFIFKKGFLLGPLPACLMSYIQTKDKKIEESDSVANIHYHPN